MFAHKAEFPPRKGALPGRDILSIPIGRLAASAATIPLSDSASDPVANRPPSPSFRERIAVDCSALSEYYFFLFGAVLILEKQMVA